MKKIVVGLMGLVGLIGGILFYTKNTSSYVVTKVIDGDTVVISGIKSPKGTVRYIGVDTPEINECFYREAKSANEHLVLGKKVRVEYDQNKMDQYGRALVYLFLEDNDEGEIMINDYLLKMGVGKYYLDTINTKYFKQFLNSANLSHTNKSGLWTECAVDRARGCDIKGNVGRDGKRYYHLPSFRHYSQTTVNFDKGD